MRLRRRTLILGAIALLAAFGLGIVGAGLLIGQSVGRDVSNELGDSIAKALWK
jgi:hypothetical protein